MLSQLSYSPTGRARLTPRVSTVKSDAGESTPRAGRPTWYFSSRPQPEWRNRQTQGPQKAPALVAMWVRVPPPAPSPRRLEYNRPAGVEPAGRAPRREGARVG